MPATRRLRFGLQTAALLLGLLARAAPGAEATFYIVDGEPVPIERAVDFAAIALGDGDEALLRERVLGFASMRAIPHERLERDFDRLLIRRQDPAPLDDFDRDVNALGTSAPAGGAIYRYRHTLLVPTGRFFVEFTNPAIPPRDAARRMGRLLCNTGPLCELEGPRALVVQADRPGRFEVRFPDPRTWEAALAEINRLMRDDAIRAAYPEFFQVPRSAYAKRASGDEVNAACIAVAEDPPPDDKLFGNQWSLRNNATNVGIGVDAGTVDADIDAVEAWEITQGSKSVIIAIVDDGIQKDHDDLEGKLLPGLWAGTLGDESHVGSDHHGTNVAGLAAAMTDNGEGIAGVARASPILPVRAITAGMLPGETGDLLAEAAMDAEVLVNSWTASDWAPDQHLNDQIGSVIEHLGRVVVFAAGNIDSTDCEWDDGAKAFYCDTAASAVSYPATVHGVIAVSATTQNDKFKTIPSYAGYPGASSTAGSVLWGSRHGPEVAVAAPGVDLFTTNVGDTYVCFSGTSAATPLVGGAAALLRALHPSATPAMVKQWLQDSADSSMVQGTEPRDDFVGHGRLDVAGALALSNAEPPAGRTRAVRTRPDRHRCASFENLPPSTTGIFAGTTPGSISENGIQMSAAAGGIATSAGRGKVSIGTGWSANGHQAALLENSAVRFDFAGLPRPPQQVTVRFRDLGAAEQIAFNGAPPTTGELMPGAHAGVSWTLTTYKRNGAREGMLVANGPVRNMTIGGEHLWVDSVCTDVGKSSTPSIGYPP